MNEDTLPPLRLPLLYFAFGSLCLVLALCGMIRYAQDFTGFYYHPRILALTHLVTLGWITSNIVGALYIVAPMSLRVQIPATRTDHLAFWIYSVGLAGMVAHFWMELPAGMAWSAGGVVLSLIVLVIRFVIRLRHAKAPGFVRLHLVLALLNVLIAGNWGLMVAINKVHGFLPTPVASNIYAHAHMAAIGWAAMMAFGVSYRLLPMFLPAEPAKGASPWIVALLLETGVLGLFVSLLLQSRFTLVFAICICVGIAVFLSVTARTAMRRKPAPPPVPPGPDFAILHVMLSLLCLVLASAAGVSLIRLPADETTLQVALAYAFIALVGFLSQMVVGLRAKIVSVFTWYHAFTRQQSTANLPRPVDMPVRVFQGFTLGLWCLGLPFTVIGIMKPSSLLIQAGAVAMLAGVLISFVNEIVILKILRRG